MHQILKNKCLTIKILKKMKIFIYEVSSIKENTNVLFKNENDAKQFIETHDKSIFEKSEKDDLFIAKRILF